MDVDAIYEEQRMKELDFIEEYFMYHVYRVNADGSRITGRSNCKTGNKYIIKYTLVPNLATLTLEIPIELYYKVDNIVRHRDIETLEYDILDKELGI